MTAIASPIAPETQRGEAVPPPGRYCVLEAPVERGDGRGRTMGFPTANMHLDTSLVPAFGIYAVRVTILQTAGRPTRHGGVASLGVRPMYRSSAPLMETHIFDFDGDLYGKTLSVELIAWLRPEQEFSDLAALIAQIDADTAAARAILQKTPDAHLT
jgi:riboflavin kinase/FMN adenylyltransferase